jgi:hypothetical protein
MALKLTRIVIALLLGLVLAARPVAALSPLAATAQTPAANSCCADCEHCQTPECCAKPDAPSVPVAPVSIPSPSQNELQALAMPAISILTLPSSLAHEHSSRFSLPASMTAVPLFQRDCCYLI